MDEDCQHHQGVLALLPHKDMGHVMSGTTQRPPGEDISMRTDLQRCQGAELLLTRCASRLEGPGVGDVVSQVVDLELEDGKDSRKLL